MSSSTPLLLSWAMHAGLRGDQAADLAQDVMLQLVKTLPDFQCRPQGTFRGWLRTILFNKHREYLRRYRLPIAEIDPLNIADSEGANRFWEQEYHLCLTQRALDLMRSEFAETSWRACWKTVVLGRSPAEVADELGIQ